MAADDPVSRLFGGSVSRRFDFGPVLSGPGIKLAHTYTLRNTSQHPVGIKEVVNGKPCCGEVEPVKPTSLSPGDSIEVRVTVKPTAGGPLSHWVSVRTDHPDVPEAILWTLAEGHPVIRIERETEAIPRLTSNGSKEVQFNLHYCEDTNDAGRKPADLDKFVIKFSRSASRIGWAGPPRAKKIGNGLVRHDRPFSIALDGGGGPGRKSAEIAVLDREGHSLYTQPIHWEVESKFKVKPASIIVKGQRRFEQDVTIESADGEEFGLVGVATDLPGASAMIRGTGKQSQHAVTVKLDLTSPLEKRRFGEIAVLTDCEAQKSVKIPIFIFKEESSQ